jgi:hypothetical protein
VVGTPTTLNVQLKLGSVNEQVTVTSAVTPVLNTTDATIGNPFNEKEVKDLPFLARNVVNLLTLQPGMVFTGQSDTDLWFDTLRHSDFRSSNTRWVSWRWLCWRI